jgi:hypothetical protein
MLTPPDSDEGDHTKWRRFESKRSLFQVSLHSTINGHVCTKSPILPACGQHVFVTYTTHAVVLTLVPDTR